MSAFSDRFDAFIAEYFRLHPLRATESGLHDHDGRWPDLTEAGRRERLDFYERWRAELAGLRDESLSRDEQIDRDLVLDELAAHRFSEETLLEERWDALTWVYVFGAGIFPLLAREFAPLAVRLASAAERIEGVPSVVAGAREALAPDAARPDGRPISRFHTEVALRQLPGVRELCSDALAAAEGAGASDPVPAELVERLRAAVAVAGGALDELEAFLREDVLPRSEGEGRLGAALFDEKLRHTLKSDLSRAEILARCDREYAAVRGEMIRLATQLWPTWVPDRALPTAGSAGSEAAAQSEIVKTVLDAIATDHPAAPDLLDFCRDELGRVEEFVREVDLVGLADEPLEIRWTPAFLRAFGGALLDPPGPLDRGQKSFFCITPLPEEWTAEQVESALREDNTRMLRLLTIHEAVPGHYLQLAYANRCPSLARAVFWSGVFAEGWAVYVTQVMMDVGYGGDDPALMLIHWKFYLRAVTNAMIDAQIHAGTMTEAEALSLMVEGGFQEESEARNKWDRARLTSTQLSTYFVGSAEMWDLELEARRRAAVASGDVRGAAAVPEPRVVGDFGPTPGFRYRDHLESVLAHGSPPTPLLRRILFG